MSTAESFELSFRTKLPSGLLLYSGDDDGDGDDGQENGDGGDDNGPDFLQLALVEAGLTLRLKLGGVGVGTVQEVRVAPSKVRFDDHQWHTVSVVRTIREVKMLGTLMRFMPAVQLSRVVSCRVCLPSLVTQTHTHTHRHTRLVN